MRLDFQVSKVELLCLVTGHLLASHVIWQSAWLLPAQLLLTLTLAVHACYQLWRCLMLLDSSVIRLEFGDQGRAWLTTRGGEVKAKLHAVPYLSPMLMLVDLLLIAEGKRYQRRWIPRYKSTRVRVLITAGSVPLAQRKQLACFLLYGN